MAAPRIPLYERLPEIYRVRDEEQMPPGQLRAYLAVVEEAFGALHRNVEGLYRDLFIETCADWAVPYIGDLLGTSHLSGDPWTVRADVAETVALRRRKGTPAALERLAFVLTRWSAHVVELRETLAWTQHLNHQRPDAGGAPPYARTSRFAPIRGGTATVRDPATLSLVGTPFDPFARTADVKPPVGSALGHNLPNVAVFLWRLEAYRVDAAHPRFVSTETISGAAGDEAVRAVRFHVDPLGRPLRLFNVAQHDPRRTPPAMAELDRAPGPILRARLDEGAPAGNPAAYVAVETWDPEMEGDGIDAADVGLQFHLPLPEFAGRVWPVADGAPAEWRIRAANLCAWEAGVRPPLRADEIAVDPMLGRVVFGLGTAADDEAEVEADAAALRAGLRVTYTYGAPGPVGAHPVSRGAAAVDGAHERVEVRFDADDPAVLETALGGVEDPGDPRVVEIRDSATYRLDLNQVPGRADEGGATLTPARTLVVRAASGERPTVLLVRPLRFRAADPAAAAEVAVRFEGIHLARDDDDWETGGGPDALIARAAVESLELDGCTLDPGGHALPNGDRAPLAASLSLVDGYGFAADSEAADAFEQTPRIVLRRTVSGALRIGRGYALSLADSVVDAGGAAGEAPGTEFAVGSAAGDAEWGPPTELSGVTALGRVRVESIRGRGGIFTQSLEAEDDQHGCIRFSWVSGVGDRLPQNLGCISGLDARLHLDAACWLQPAYARVGLASDFRVRERGPGDEPMGAYGFLREASRMRNLRVRFREFVPAGIRALVIPVT